MNGLFRLVLIFLMGTLVLGLVGCATTREATPEESSTGLVPDEDTPSHDDMSHGWGVGAGGSH